MQNAGWFIVGVGLLIAVIGLGYVFCRRFLGWVDCPVTS